MEPLLDLALLLFGGKVGGILFSKIRQPSVVGEIIAGIILGPSLLALIRPSALVTSVADLGLLFLILLVSLSIDWKGLEGDTEKYVYVELARAGIALGMTYVIGLTVGWDLFTTVAIGLVAVLSSTSIVSRALADFKQFGSAVGQALMGMEIVDEVVGIVAISLLANVVRGGSFSFEPILTTVFIAVGLLVVMKRVGVQFVNRVIASIQKYGIEEALLGFTLLLAFILGSVTESLHLESILGIFIAGMILSRSAQSPIITRKVKEIGESFFIPIFFASVGLALNLQTAGTYLGTIAFVIVVVVGVKLVSAFAAMTAFSYSGKDALRLASGFATLSELTVVIVALAGDLLTPAYTISLVAAFVIVNTIAPVVMNWAFHTNREISVSLPQRSRQGWRAPAQRRFL